MRPTSVCEVPGCEREVRTTTLCHMHRKRLARHGTTDPAAGRRDGVAMGKVPTDPSARFWEKVDKAGECWLWTAARNVQGYGIFTVRVEGKGPRPVIASRYVYEMTHGALAPNVVVRHMCDNRPCVNPSHLETGSHSDNMRDMRERGRSRAGERHAMAKLTNQDVANIRDRIATGEKYVSIARSLGVSDTTIQDIAAGRSWKSTLPNNPQGEPHE